MSAQFIFGTIAIIIAFVSYIPYFKDIYTETTKPHLFSWLIWTILTLIAFISQLADGAGFGGWVTGFSAFLGLLIIGYSYNKGEKEITSSDWWILFAALAITSIYIFTKDAFLATFLTTSVTVIGFIPTVRKSYSKPFQETLSAYVLTAIKYLFAIAALDNFSFTTLFFPAAAVIMNVCFSWLLVSRRRILSTPKTKLAYAKAKRRKPKK